MWKKVGEAKWDVRAGSGLSFREGEELSRFMFRVDSPSEWFPQSSSARTLQLVFGLWHHPSWCSGLPSEHNLQWHSLPSSLQCLSYLCSLNLTYSVHLVSSTYTTEQYLQGASYTTPAAFYSEVLFFTCIRSLSRVCIGLETGFTSKEAQTFSVFSFGPLMSGVQRTLGVLSCGK